MWLVFFGLAILTACSQPRQPPATNSETSLKPDTTIPVPQEKIPVDSSTTTTTEPTTEPVPEIEPSVVEVPILCPKYGHPKHHFSCKEVDAQQQLSNTISTPTTIGHSHFVPQTAGSVDNLSSLPACIAKYESTSGQADSNIYQFVPSTWRAYGGEGSPGDASVDRQTEVFWAAWADGGPQHWAAQKGRCF